MSGGPRLFGALVPGHVRTGALQWETLRWYRTPRRLRTAELITTDQMGTPVAWFGVDDGPVLLI